MRLSSFLLLLNFIITDSFTQNLIPSPGFELHDTCPNTTSQFDYCSYWNNIENTCDYFNSCDILPIASIPNNYFGYQPSHSGCAYVGLGAYVATVINYREYFQTKFITTLIVGNKYYFSFYINLFNGFGSCAGTGKMGFKLSTMPYLIGNNGSPATDNMASFYTDSIVTDTIGWTKISGSLIADSAYQYITFGNFFDDAHTPYTILIGVPSNIVSYYYIDDVCFSTDSLTCVNVTDTCHAASPLGITNLSKNDIMVYPNPILDEVIVENKNNNEELDMEIRDMAGRILYTKTFIGQNRCELAGLKRGMYFYEVRKKGRLVKTGKMVKE